MNTLVDKFKIGLTLFTVAYTETSNSMRQRVGDQRSLFNVYQMI